MSLGSLASAGRNAFTKAVRRANSLLLTEETFPSKKLLEKPDEFVAIPRINIETEWDDCDRASIAPSGRGSSAASLRSMSSANSSNSSISTTSSIDSLQSSGSESYIEYLAQRKQRQAESKVPTKEREGFIDSSTDHIVLPYDLVIVDKPEFRKKAASDPRSNLGLKETYYHYIDSMFTPATLSDGIVAMSSRAISKPSLPGIILAASSQEGTLGGKTSAVTAEIASGKKSRLMRCFSDLKAQQSHLVEHKDFPVKLRLAIKKDIDTAIEQAIANTPVNEAYVKDLLYRRTDYATAQVAGPPVKKGKETMKILKYLRHRLPKESPARASARTIHKGLLTGSKKPLRYALIGSSGTGKSSFGKRSLKAVGIKFKTPKLFDWKNFTHSSGEQKPGPLAQIQDKVKSVLSPLEAAVWELPGNGAILADEAIKALNKDQEDASATLEQKELKISSLDTSLHFTQHFFITGNVPVGNGAGLRRRLLEVLFPDVSPEQKLKEMDRKIRKLIKKLSPSETEKLSKYEALKSNEELKKAIIDQDPTTGVIFVRKVVEQWLDISKNDTQEAILAEVEKIKASFNPVSSFIPASERKSPPTRAETY